MDALDRFEVLDMELVNDCLFLGREDSSLIPLLFLELQPEGFVLNLHLSQLLGRLGENRPAVVFAHLVVDSDARWGGRP